MTFKHIFSLINKTDSRKFNIKASYIEVYLMQIYNEQVNDLLNSSKTNLEIRESLYTGIYIHGITEIVLKDVNHAMELLWTGDHTKKLAETQMNSKSSRSHTVFRLLVESQDNKKYLSTLNIVDLAGSEAVSKTKAENERLT